MQNTVAQVQSLVALRRRHRHRVIGVRGGGSVHGALPLKRFCSMPTIQIKGGAGSGTPGDFRCTA
ncbi:protein of unknown function [Burkholderia multivorans]